MKFAKEELKDDIGDPATTVLQEIVGRGRWVIQYRRVFRFEDKLYETHFQRGATEQQDEMPYEHDDEQIECPEVVAVAKTVTVYERVPA